MPAKKKAAAPVPPMTASDKAIRSKAYEEKLKAVTPKTTGKEVSNLLKRADRQSGMTKASRQYRAKNK